MNNLVRFKLECSQLRNPIYCGPLVPEHTVTILKVIRILGLPSLVLFSNLLA